MVDIKLSSIDGFDVLKDFFTKSAVKTCTAIRSGDPIRISRQLDDMSNARNGLLTQLYAELADLTYNGAPRTETRKARMVIEYSEAEFDNLLTGLNTALAIVRCSETSNKCTS